MGWGDCGTDSNGRNIGYVFEALCDHNGCNEKIDRGLAYACGNMHGETEFGCEKYFCDEHLIHGLEEDGQLCEECYGLLESEAA